MVETKSIGIMQSDVVIRTAIMKAFRELRKDPRLLEYCFAWLPNDDLTAAEYGEPTVEKAKKWFLNTDIKVTLDVRVDAAKLPAITISLDSSQETDATLGDVNYEPGEDGPDEGEATNLESVRHQESYTITMYVQGEPEHLLFLNSIMMFALYRYKKEYFEARGFEVSTIRVGQMARLSDMESEMVYARPIIMTGTVRHYWPSNQGPKLTSLDFLKSADAQSPGLKIIAEEFRTTPKLPTDPAWGMLDDDITVRR